jgi:hypothetical protein
MQVGCIASTASKALMIGMMNLISKVDWYDMEVSQVVALQTHKIRWPWKKIQDRLTPQHTLIPCNFSLLAIFRCPRVQQKIGLPS